MRIFFILLAMLASSSSWAVSGYLSVTTPSLSEQPSDSSITPEEYAAYTRIVQLYYWSSNMYGVANSRRENELSKDILSRSDVGTLVVDAFLKALLVALEKPKYGTEYTPRQVWARTLVYCTFTLLKQIDEKQSKLSLFFWKKKKWFQDKTTFSTYSDPAKAENLIRLSTVSAASSVVIITHSAWGFLGAGSYELGTRIGRALFNRDTHGSRGAASLASQIKKAFLEKRSEFGIENAPKNLELLVTALTQKLKMKFPKATLNGRELESFGVDSLALSTTMSLCADYLKATGHEVVQTSSILGSVPPNETFWPNPKKQAR